MYNTSSRGDYDGKFLKSLSLEDSGDDSIYHTVNSHSNHSRYEDDTEYMDIDHTYDTLMHNISNRSVHYDSSRETPEIEMKDEDYEEDDDLIDLTLDLQSSRSTPVTKLSVSHSTPVQENELTHIKENHKVNVYNDNINDDEEVDDETQTSFVSHIFSPTTLGAQLAIRKPQLLLLPGPATSDNTNEDISESVEEYDLSDYNNSHDDNKEIILRQRHFSSFSNSNSNIFLTGNKRAVEVEEPIEATEGFIRNDVQYPTFNSGMSMGPSHSSSNNISASPFMQGTHQHIHNHHQPVQILHQHQHHHHYYYNKEDNSTKNSDSSVIVGTDINKDKQQLIHAYPTHANQIKLPLPWKSNISPIERIPYLLSSYLQLLINCAISAYSIYLVIKVISVVKHDINIKLNEFTANVMVEIESCRRSYFDNNCTPDLIVPALEAQCSYWSKCMNQVTTNGGGNISIISAETVGIILNSFVEPLGLKFFLIMGLSVIVLFLLNFMFGYIRAKTYYGWQDYPNYNYGISKNNHMTDTNNNNNNNNNNSTMQQKSFKLLWPSREEGMQQQKLDPMAHAEQRIVSTW
ncbi:Di-sulfide bridge nucleocytoplasmic transport domain-containing protein [Scheffersomyces amazonensis]|uniref:Di-sulfide bridge nucleocytoplasmic transport domain-containing protein n=1 Tax=Scheffersomyces amazonensis TaxID=1078765 RepID=UPI00315CE9D8